ncbi:hypothetical protein OG897_24335 [Streptomyces sp. NBC_00237]|uniref:hypothetical protein n=1 Tax=Streptomyces sp. NBC_00237 TaxID=2975687 RepID=UPI00225661EE|nr:hypothetical protein [Streptomyces sp. NBC_00237]MCX5204570.1 hypothetical protein [Streptomyces sp. NBC_00237]
MNVSQAMIQFVPLAAGDTFDKNKVTPGILGFLVFAALAVGVWLLMKSMNRHMGKVSFEEAPDPDAPGEASAAAPAKGEKASAVPSKESGQRE